MPPRDLWRMYQQVFLSWCHPVAALITVLSAQPIKDNCWMLFIFQKFWLKWTISVWILFCISIISFHSLQVWPKFSNFASFKKSKRRISTSGTEYMLINRPDMATSSFFVSWIHPGWWAQSFDEVHRPTRTRNQEPSLSVHVDPSPGPPWVWVKN